nr:MAG TPA: peptidase [Caudoviricetes sp.]
MARKDSHGSKRSIQSILSKAMIKPLKITANLGEMMVKGSMREYFQTELPALDGFLSDNADLGQNIVYAVQKPKDAISKALDRFDKTETIQAARKIADAAISDLKTGEFYKEYRDRDGNDDLLGDFGGFDFDGFDDDGNWDDSFDDSSSSGDNTAMQIAEMQENNADNRTEAMLAAIGSSTEATNRTNLAIHKDDIKSALKRHAQTMTSLANVTTMTAAIHETMNNHLTAMTEMSREMHNQMITEVREIKGLLTEIRDHQIPKKVDKKAREDKFPIDRYTGALDIKKYFKGAAAKALDITGLDMVTSAIDPETIAELYSQNPWQIVTDKLLRMIIPKSTKKKLNEFDNQVKGFFPSLLNRIYNYGEKHSVDEGREGILAMIAQVFGVKADQKGYIDPAKYNKDKVDFTGKVAKAITEVMPAQLSKIISLLSGEPTRLYDYEKGKFVNATKTFAEVARRSEDNVSDMFESRNMLLSRVNSANFKYTNDEQKQELRDDIFRFLKEAGNHQYFIDQGGFRAGEQVSKADRTAAFEKFKDKYADALPVDDDNMAAIFAIISSLSHAELGQLNSDIINSRRNRQDRIERINEDLSKSGLMSLYNGLNMSAKEQRAIMNKVMDTENSVTSMNDNEYHKLLGDTISEYKSTSMTGILTDIKAILNRGIIVYSSNLSSSNGATPSNGYKAALDAQADTMKALGKPTGDTFQSTADSILDEQRKKEEEADKKKKYKEELIAKSKNGGTAVFGESDISDMIDAFVGTEYETVKIYENEDERKAYEKKKERVDKIKGKMGKPGEKLSALFRKPFELLERGLSFMDEHMYRIAFGDEAAKILEKGKKSDTSIFDGVLNMVKMHLTNFADWFKTSILDRLFNDTDAPFRKAKDFAKKWTVDKAKSGWTKLKEFAIGTKGEDGTYSGGKFSDFATRMSDSAKSTKDKVKENASGILDQFKNTINTVLYGDGEWRQGVDANGNKVGDPYFMRGTGGVVGMFKEASTNLKNFLFGTDPNSDSKNIWDKTVKETKTALPGAITGAAMGGIGTMGAGLLTGLWLPGGPVFGAMLGSAAGFIGASDTLKNYIFGPAIDPTDPSKGRKGGLIEKNVQDAVKQYVPKIALGAGIGAIAGNFGILPAGLGPVAGAAIGSFGGLIGANKEFREVIFGNEDDDDSGYISKNTRKKIAQSLPAAITGGLGVNVIVGRMNGMGLLPSLISMPGGPVVTAIGALTGVFAGKHLQNFFFGEKDKDGKWIPGKEGVFGKMFNFGKEKIFDPFFNRVNQMAKSIGKWFGDQIMEPLKKAMDPIKEALKNGGGIIRKTFKFFGNILKGAIDGVFSRIFGKPLSEMADNLMKKVRGATNFIVTSIGKALGAAISAPFRLIGGIGEHLGKKQAKQRNKRFKEWKKEHPDGTEQEFNEYDRKNGHFVSNLVADAHDKANAPGSSKKNPKLVAEEQAKADREAMNKAAINDAGLTDKVMRQNDKANPINSAQARTASATEQTSKKLDTLIGLVKGKNLSSTDKIDASGKKHSTTLGAQLGDNAIQTFADSAMSEKTAKGDKKKKNSKRKTTAQLYDPFIKKLEDDSVDQISFDDMPDIVNGGDGTDATQVTRGDDGQLVMKGFRGKRTRSKTKMKKAKIFDKFSWTGEAGGVSRKGIIYTMLYKKFNSRIANASTPEEKQRIMDEIIVNAPKGQVDLYRTVLTDIARLNNPDDSYTGGMGGTPASGDDKKSGGLLDLLTSNAGMIGGIAALLLTMVGGGGGSTIANVIKGVIGAKVASKVIKIGKGIWDFGTKAKSAISGINNALTTSPALNAFSSTGIGAYQLMDKDETNDSFAVHNFVNAGRSTWAGINQAAEAGAKALGKTGEVRSLTQKIAMAIRNKVSKVAASSAVKKLAGNKFVTALRNVAQTVSKFITSHVPGLLKKASKSGAEAGVRQASAIPIAGLIITTAFGVWDIFSGMADSYKYFGVKPSEATLGMKLSAGFCKLVVGLLTAIPGIGMFLSMIPVKPLATALYKLFAGDDAVKELTSKQENMQQQVDEYNQANGTDYDVSEYLDKVDPDTGEEKKHWWQKAGSAIKSFFTGDDGSNRVMDESQVMTMSGGKYMTTQKPAKGIRYTTTNLNVNGKSTKYYILDKASYDEWKKKDSSGSGRGRWGHGPNTVFSQTDPKWTSQDPTMKDSGCGPTVAAMMAERLGRGANPVEASQMAYAGGYRDSSGGTNPDFFSAYGNAHGVSMHEGSTDSGSIGTSLDSGSPVALMGQGGAFGSGSHYLLADKKNGNNVSLIDPIGGKRISSSLSSLANKTTAAIYGHGTSTAKVGTYSPSGASDAKAMTGNRLTAREIGRKTAKVGRVLPDTYGTGRFSGYWGRGTAKEQAAAVLKVAEGEVGYHEKASSSQLDDKTANPGANNYTKYGAWYGLNGPGAPWCAMFVAWCCSKAGVSTSVVPKTASVSEFTSFAKSHNQFHSKGSYTPQPGDIIIYGSGGGDHTGLVYGTDGTNVITIEGNTSGGNESNGVLCKKKSVPMSESWIYGYFSPAYDGKTVAFDGTSSDSSEESEDSSTPTGLAILTNSISEKFKPITDALTNAANPLQKKLDAILGTSTTSDESDGSSNSSSSGSLPSGDEMIGDYTKQFESGDAGPESISNSPGDAGGTSFGTYQFPSNGQTYTTGSLLNKFWDTYYAKDYPNVKPGDNSAFKDAWKAAVAKDKKLFHKREWMIAKTGDYDTALASLKSKFNYDPDKDSRAAQEAIWSTAMQGPAIVPGDYSEAFGNTDSTSMDDAEWVKKFYAAKRNRVGSDFRSCSSGVQASVRNRYVEEEPIVAKLAGQKPLDYGKGRAMTSDLNDRIRSTNSQLGKGRELAEANARTDFIARKIDSLKDENLGKGPGNADNSVLNKMLDIFQQIVPILQNIETNTAKSQHVEVGRGSETRNSVEHSSFGKGTEPTVTPRTKRARIGAVVDVGTASIDKITRR